MLHPSHELARALFVYPFAKRLRVIAEFLLVFIDEIENEVRLLLGTVQIGFGDDFFAKNDQVMILT